MSSTPPPPSVQVPTTTTTTEEVKQNQVLSPVNEEHEEQQEEGDEEYYDEQSGEFEGADEGDEVEEEPEEPEQEEAEEMHEVEIKIPEQKEQKDQKEQKPTIRRSRQVGDKKKKRSPKADSTKKPTVMKRPEPPIPKQATWYFGGLIGTTIVATIVIIIGFFVTGKTETFFIFVGLDTATILGLIILFWRYIKEQVTVAKHWFAVHKHLHSTPYENTEVITTVNKMSINNTYMVFALLWIGALLPLATLFFCLPPLALQGEVGSQLSKMSGGETAIFSLLIIFEVGAIISALALIWSFLYSLIQSYVLQQRHNYKKEQYLKILKEENKQLKAQFDAVMQMQKQQPTTDK